MCVRVMWSKFSITLKYPSKAVSGSGIKVNRLPVKYETQEILKVLDMSINGEQDGPLHPSTYRVKARDQACAV